MRQNRAIDARLRRAEEMPIFRRPKSMLLNGPHTITILLPFPSTISEVTSDGNGVLVCYGQPRPSERQRLALDYFTS